MRLNPLEIRYGMGGWGGGTFAWIIVVRDQGHVETLEPGQTSYMPVFRTRRVSCNFNDIKVRVLVGAKARLNFADESVLHLNGPLEVTIVPSDTATIDSDKVFYMRLGKCADDVARLSWQAVQYLNRNPLRPLGGRG